MIARKFHLRKVNLQIKKQLKSKEIRKPFKNFHEKRKNDKERK